MPKEHRGAPHALLLSALGLSLSACAGKSQATPSPPFVVHGDATLLFSSGTRLKAHYLDAGGGARQLVAFHDTLLDIECNFVETSLGQYACLPVLDTISYSDAACTAPTFSAKTLCSGEPAFFSGELFSAGSTSCDALASAYSIDTQQTQDHGFLLTITGSCQAPSVKLAPQAEWTAKPEPLARFAQGTPSVIGQPGGTQATRVTSEDGAFTTLGLVAAGEPCSVVSIDGAERCVPGPLTERSMDAYSDSNCSKLDVAESRIPLEQQCAGEQPKYMLDYTTKNCVTNAAAYAVGEPLSTVFSTGDSCGPYALERPGYTGLSYYRIGARVAGSAFPVAHLAKLGTGALTTGCIADSVGTPILAVGALGAWALPDGSPCQLLEDPSGQKRCLHDYLSMSYLAYFADASCTRQVYGGYSICGGPPVEYLVAGSAGICSSAFTQIYAAEPYTGPVYSTISGSCQPRDAQNDDPGAEFMTPGDPVDLSVFPILADTTDP